MYRALYAASRVGGLCDCKFTRCTQTRPRDIFSQTRRHVLGGLAARCWRTSGDKQLIRNVCKVNETKKEKKMLEEAEAWLLRTNAVASLDLVGMAP